MERSSHVREPSTRERIQDESNSISAIGDNTEDLKEGSQGSSDISEENTFTSLIQAEKEKSSTSNEFHAYDQGSFITQQNEHLRRIEVKTETYFKGIQVFYLTICVRTTYLSL